MKAREQQQKFISDEVRLRMVENGIMDIKKEFTELKAEVKSNFRWTIGVVITSNIIPSALVILLHIVKVI